MKIVQLNAENVKRIQAIEIRPDGSLVQITGRNAQGKSSVLDSIAYALGGKDLICDMPVRKGSKKAEIIVDLGEMVVRRGMTATGGGSLTITGKDGVTMKSPQSILDALHSKLSFDPLAFARMDPKKQADSLRNLVGLDFTAIDAERKAAYEQRTIENRRVSELEAQLRAMPVHVDAPTEEVSVGLLMTKVTDAQRVNEEVELRTRNIQGDERLLAQRSEEVASLRTKLAHAEKMEQEQRGSVELRRKSLSEVSRIDIAPLQKAVMESDAINRKVRDNAAEKSARAKLATVAKIAKNFDQKVNALDEQKAAMLANASFPVEGLTFDDSGVLLNGIPFSQASAAEQLRTSVGIGLASNPKLRVLLIRDGSLLDKDGLEMIAQMAEGYDAQVWIEKVSDDSKVGIVIEDGMVLEDDTKREENA